MTLLNSLEEYCCSGYADDTTVAACTDASIEETFSIYGQYEQASGVCLNRGKSKGTWAGSWKDRTDTPYGIQWVKDLPLLSATFTLAIRAGQHGSQPFPHLSSALPAGLVGSFPSKERLSSPIP